MTTISGTYSPEDLIAQLGGRTQEEADQVMAKGHPPEADKLILIDFDGTIRPFGLLFGNGPPLDGVSQFTKIMKEKGYRIGIFTSRLNKQWLESVKQTKEQHEEYITRYNNDNGVLFDFITSDKFPCEQYFDDKATNVNNNWAEIIEAWSGV